MPEWFCERCRRWVNGARCRVCRQVMDPGPLGFTYPERRAIDNREMDG